MEHPENILGPKYSIRMRDLRHWHIVTASCLQCRHQTEFTGDFLAWERSPHASEIAQAAVYPTRQPGEEYLLGTEGGEELGARPKVKGGRRRPSWRNR